MMQISHTSLSSSKSLRLIINRDQTSVKRLIRPRSKYHLLRYLLLTCDLFGKSLYEHFHANKIIHAKTQNWICKVYNILGFTQNQQIIDNTHIPLLLCAIEATLTHLGYLETLNPFFFPSS